MLSWFGSTAVVGVLFCAVDAERSLIVSSTKTMPEVTSVLVYEAGTDRTGKTPPEPVLTSSKLGEKMTLPKDGPYDIIVRTKGGLDVVIASKLKFETGKAVELKLADLLGMVEVFGDNFPRADNVVVTSPDDPGPGEKGHTPVQSGMDYRVEMLLPVGFYAVWVQPSNGARAQKVAEKIRVQAGRTTRVGD